MRSPQTVPLLFCTAGIQIILLLMSGCECPGPQTYRMALDSTSLSFFDNSGTEPVTPTGDVIPVRAFGIYLFIHGKRLALADAHGGGSGTAWATPPCDQYPDSYVPVDTVRTVRLFRMDQGGGVDDVGENFMAGNFSENPEEFPTWFRSFEALPEILNSYPDKHYQRFAGSAFLREGFDRMRGEDLRFIIQVELTNGKILRDTSEQITLE